MTIKRDLTSVAIWEVTQMVAVRMDPIVDGSDEDGDARFCVVDSGFSSPGKF